MKYTAKIYTWKQKTRQLSLGIYKINCLHRRCMCYISQKNMEVFGSVFPLLIVVNPYKGRSIFPANPSFCSDGLRFGPPPVRPLILCLLLAGGLSSSGSPQVGAPPISGHSSDSALVHPSLLLVLVGSRHLELPLPLYPS